jgi:hypothetical protein
MQGNRNILGMTGSQANASVQQAVSQLQASYSASQAPSVGIYDLIGSAHDAVSALRQEIEAVEKIFGPVLMPACGDGTDTSPANGAAASVDSAAVDTLRSLIYRIREAAAMVGSLGDRAQV